ncbi:hypothetical protein [Neolewinella persica]|uniref:hypothetical protein n=1 Tax=Neolewinella persica TaxID=70998 RepID=UPI0003760EAB|nr:hypothetical protein [Neolewinella persica]
MLIRQATLAQTTPQLRVAYDQFFLELTPEQQQQVNFEQVQTDVHNVVSKKRNLNLNLGIGPVSRADTIQEITRTITAHDSKHNNTRSTAPRDSLDCGVAITMVVVDSVMLVIQAIGLPGAIAERSAAKLVTETAPLIRRSLAVFRSLVHNVERAVDAAAKAKAYYAIFVTFTRTFGLKAIFKEIRNTMHWYDWLILGLTIVLQVVLLIATDGVAIILQVAMLIVSIGALGVAVLNAVNACKLPDVGTGAPDMVDKGWVLLPGESLKINEKMVSSNGKYWLYQGENGNTILSTTEDHGRWEKNVIWTSKVYGKQGLGLALFMSKEGDLSVRSSASSPERFWTAFSRGVPGNFAVVSNDGRLQVFNSGTGALLWSSNAPIT